MDERSNEQNPDEEAKSLYKETRDDLLKRQLSNSENYDKAVLSLSTIFLGLSLSFLKNIIPLQYVIQLWVLYSSWASLALAVLCTLGSFLVSQIAINEQLKKAEDYYINGKRDALKKSSSAKWTDRLNWASGIFFIVGVVLTMVFVIGNTSKEIIMSGENKSNQTQLNEGHLIQPLQQVKIKKGAPIPSIQPVSQNQPSQSQPTPSNNPPTSSPSNATSSGGGK